MYGVVYKITCLINKKLYIGQTRKSIEKRFKQHAKTDSLIGRDIRKYGIENFKIEIIEHCESKAQLNEREKFWINTLNSKQPYGYNVKDGGGDYERQITPLVKNDENLILNEKLKYLRQNKEISKKYLCNQIGLSESTYCRYESGVTQPNPDVLKLIANFFDVSVDYLLDNQFFSDNELIDLQNFLEKGNYTVYGRFLTEKERRKLIAMLEILFKD